MDGFFALSKIEQSLVTGHCLLPKNLLISACKRVDETALDSRKRALHPG